MKPLLTCLALGASVLAMAQQPPVFKKYNPDLYFGDSAKIKNRITIDRGQAKLYPGEQGLLGNRIGSSHLGSVYALPQDGMPCIVPDANTHQHMPVAGNGMILTDPGIYLHKPRIRKKTITK